MMQQQTYLLMMIRGNYSVMLGVCLVSFSATMATLFTDPWRQHWGGRGGAKNRLLDIYGSFHPFHLVVESLILQWILCVLMYDIIPTLQASSVYPSPISPHPQYSDLAPSKPLPRQPNHLSQLWTHSVVLPKVIFLFTIRMSRCTA